ncbi:hypothetical protein [Candidatus Lokiarchaeum ossiferum]|uniref:hypothetical protein n=1 Tax=Candidatus Lokiarchaeum ossiferum TaxID=2951803 RepID=UPI00352F0D64
MSPTQSKNKPKTALSKQEIIDSLEVGNIKLELIKKLDIVSEMKNKGRKKGKPIDFYNKYAKKYTWFEHPKNLIAINDKMGASPSISRVETLLDTYLNTAKKFFNYLQQNPTYEDSFGQWNYYEIFDFLTETDKDTFAKYYNEFNYGMGNPDQETRDLWVEKHHEYLPHGQKAKSDKFGVVLAHNWRLTPQNKMQAYFQLIRPYAFTEKKFQWSTNTKDAGKSSGNEIILDKPMLNRFLELLPVNHRLLAMFMACTGLRVGDATYQLTNNWDKLQIFPETSKDSETDNQRYYLQNIETEKKDKNIAVMFLSKEFTDLVKYIAGVDDARKAEMGLLLKKHNYKAKEFMVNGVELYHGIEITPENEEAIRSMRKEIKNYVIKKKNLQERLAGIAKIIRKDNPEWQKGKTVRTHLFRKYWMSETGKSPELQSKIEPDLLNYLSAHKTHDPLFTTYHQYVMDVPVMYRKFIEFIEPAISSRYSIIDRTSEEVIRLSEEMEQKDLEMARLKTVVLDHSSFNSAVLQTVGKREKALFEMYSKIAEERKESRRLKEMIKAKGKKPKKVETIPESSKSRTRNVHESCGKVFYGQPSHCPKCNEELAWD